MLAGVGVGSRALLYTGWSRTISKETRGGNDNVHQWVVFLHVASVLGFMLGHGGSVIAMWQLRWEADPQRTLNLLNAEPNVPLRILLGVVVLTGVLAGFTGSSWGQAWIWISIVLLALIAVAMWRWGGPYYGLVEDAASRAVAARADPGGGTEAQHDFDAARHAWHPIGMTVIGLGGTAVILWLMMFKPF